jgi:hypothetical protein
MRTCDILLMSFLLRCREHERVPAHKTHLIFSKIYILLMMISQPSGRIYQRMFIRMMSFADDDDDDVIVINDDDIVVCGDGFVVCADENTCGHARINDARQCKPSADRKNSSFDTKCHEVPKTCIIGYTRVTGYLLTDNPRAMTLRVKA